MRKKKEGAYCQFQIVKFPWPATLCVHAGDLACSGPKLDDVPNRICMYAHETSDLDWFECQRKDNYSLLRVRTDISIVGWHDW
jgi:hypothetical protein